MGIVLGLIGVTVTILYVAAVVYLYGDLDLRSLEINVVGDFLAGISSPLAFLWLVLGFFLQGLELRASRKALAQQAQELANSVEQHKALVEVSRQQLKAEIDARETERRMLVLKAQPELVIHPAGYRGDGTGGFQQHFSLYNGGHSITDVMFSWSSPLECSFEKCPILREDSKIEFTLTGDRKRALDAILSVKYKDGLGEAQEIKFLLSKTDAAFGAPYQIEKVKGEVVGA